MPIRKARWLRLYRRLGPVLILAMLLASFPAGISVRSKVAHASCDPSVSDAGRNNNTYPVSRLAASYKRASDVGASYIGGTYANIASNSPYVHFLSNGNPPGGILPSSNVSAWVMIRNNGWSTDYYAQVGWIKYGNGNINRFYEYKYGSVYPSGAWYLSQASGNNYFSVQYNDPTAGKISFYQNSGWLFTTPYMPINPNEGKVGAETHTKHDQMPGVKDYAEGGSGPHMHFWDAHVYYNGGWNDLAGWGDNSDSSNYGLQSNPPSGSTTDFDVWDKDCAS